MRAPASRQSSLKGPGSEDDLTDIYVTKKMANRLSLTLDRQDSKSWEDTQQVLYDNSKSLTEARVGATIRTRSTFSDQGWLLIMID